MWLEGLEKLCQHAPKRPKGTLDSRRYLVRSLVGLEGLYAAKTKLAFPLTSWPVHFSLVIASSVAPNVLYECQPHESVAESRLADRSSLRIIRCDVPEHHDSFSVVYPQHL